MTRITRKRVLWLHDAASELASTKLRMTMKPEEVLQLTTALLAGMDQEPVAWDYEWASYVTCEGPQGFKRVIEREAPPEWAIDEGRVRDIIPLYATPQPAPELLAIIERLNLSGYEHENEGVTPKNAAAVVDTLLKQLDDAVQKPLAAVPDEINVLQAANLILTLGVLDNGIPTVAMKVWNACRAAMLKNNL